MDTGDSTSSHSVAAPAMEIVVYLSIVLLAALMGLEQVLDKPYEIGLVWSSTLGLTLAHLFAFRISMVYEEGFGLRAEWGVIGRMLAAAALLAFVVTVPYLLPFDRFDPALVAAGILTVVLSVSAWLAARSRFASTSSRVVYTGAAVAIAVALAVVKTWLSY